MICFIYAIDIIIRQFCVMTSVVRVTSNGWNVSCQMGATVSRQMNEIASRKEAHQQLPLPEEHVRERSHIQNCLQQLRLGTVSCFGPPPRIFSDKALSVALSWHKFQAVHILLAAQIEDG